MKTINKNIFILFIFQVCATFSAQSEIKATSNFPKVTISLSINDADLEKGETPQIVLLISQYPFSSLDITKSEHVRYEKEAANRQSVTFNIIPPSELFYIHLAYSGQKVYTNFYHIDHVYLLKAGGHISGELRPNQAIFSGKGAALLNYQSELFRHYYNPSEYDLTLLNSGAYGDYIRSQDQQLDSVLSVQLAILKKYKKKLGEKLTGILTANCYGLRYYNQLRGHSFGNSTYYSALKAYYSNPRLLIGEEMMSTKYAALAQTYSAYILERMNLEERIRIGKSSGPLPQSSVSVLIKRILKEFHGIFRDKLMAQFFVRFDANSYIYEYLDTVLSIVKEPGYRQILQSKKLSMTNKTPVKDFQFIDSTGKSYSLKNLKNKVVLMDFWYTGCVNCIILNNAMEPVYKYFDGNDKLIFVNVSIDKDRTKWMNSVRSGKYTHQQSLNLYTGGEGTNNDFLKYYNIAGFPRIFVFKDGKMISAVPPVPTKGKGTVLSDTTRDLIRILNKAINQ